MAQNFPRCKLDLKAKLLLKPFFREQPFNRKKKKQEKILKICTTRKGSGSPNVVGHTLELICRLKKYKCICKKLDPLREGDKLAHMITYAILRIS